MTRMDQVSTPTTLLLRDRVVAYAGRRVDDSDHGLLARLSGGLVLKGIDGAAAAGRLRATGYDGAVMIDPATYDRDEPVRETLFSRFGDWAAIQADHRVAAYLSPSRFIPRSDSSALRSVLDAGTDFAAEVGKADPSATTFTIVALERSWLTRDRWSLIQALSDFRRPVALILADRNDPLDSMAVIEGLVQVLSATREYGAALLRSDLAALGAIAHGAIAGAIGTHASVRHTVPPAKSAGGSPNDRSPSVLVRALMRYMKGSWLGQLEGDRDLLYCPCEVCDGRPLSRFDDERLDREAQLHSLIAWRGLAESLLSAVASERPRTWAAMCDRALQRHDDLIDRRGVILDAPRSLVAWSRLGT